MALILNECENNTVALILYTQPNIRLHPQQNCITNIKVSGYLKQDDTNKQLCKFIDVSLTTNGTFESNSKTGQWRPQTQAWIISKYYDKRNGINQSNKYWHDKQLLDVVRHKKLMDWCVDVTIIDREGVSYTVTIQNVTVKPLSDVTEIVEPSAPIVREVDPKLQAVGELLTYALIQLEIGSICWSHLNKLSMLDFTTTTANSTIRECFSSIHQDLRNRTVMEPTLPATIELDKVFKHCLNHIYNLEAAVSRGAILTNQLPKAICELRDMSKLLIRNAIDKINHHNKVVSPYKTRDLIDVVIDVPHIAGLVSQLQIVVDRIEDSMATQTSIQDIKADIAEIVNELRRLYEQLPILGSQLEEISGGILEDFAAYCKDLGDKIDLYESKTAQNIATAFGELGTLVVDDRVVLDKIESNVEILVNREVGKPVSLGKPQVLNTPIHGLKDANNNYGPPSYQSAITTLQFLSTNKNALAGTTGPLPFSPASTSLVSSYLSVSGCTVNMCLGPLLTYGDYLVTDGNTILSKLVPYNEIDLFEDLKLRIWYNAATQTDFMNLIKTAVFYGSFAEPPLLLSN